MKIETKKKRFTLSKKAKNVIVRFFTLVVILVGLSALGFIISLGARHKSAPTDKYSIKDVQYLENKSDYKLCYVEGVCDGWSSSGFGWVSNKDIEEFKTQKDNTLLVVNIMRNSNVWRVAETSILDTDVPISDAISFYNEKEIE